MPMHEPMFHLRVRVLRVLTYCAAQYTLTDRLTEADARALVAGLNLLNGHEPDALVAYLDAHETPAIASPSAEHHEHDTITAHAAQLFGVTPAEVTPIMRWAAKRQLYQTHYGAPLARDTRDTRTANDTPVVSFAETAPPAAGALVLGTLLLSASAFTLLSLPTLMRLL